MVRVRAHVRRLKSGKVTRVRSHERRTPGPSSTSSGLFLIVPGALVFFGLVFIGVQALGHSIPVASETEKPAHSQATAPDALPPGPEGVLAGKLRQARTNIGLSQSEVSARTGIAESTINDFEQARAVPSADTLKKLSNAYQLSLNEWSALEIARAELR
ncbi:helix-turn-helix domain-containing protein [[Actinomadura] parvosata]|uniref:helix-turn-helix domain-containing protein n=1 Tax=[Actinomadura] parvosata TaxID=1955412 RepID=UPI0009AC6A3D|nr:helix-turn-helix transcriptional regulator [Nonomuraea sp. ATCC 55076]